MINHFVSADKILLVSTLLTLAACGGNSTDSDDVSDTTTDNPVVDVQTPACDIARTLIANTSCETDGGTLQLPVNSEVSGTVAVGRNQVYEVPGDAQIVLTSVQGNADLAIYNSTDLNNENLLCVANKPFLEDICTTPASDAPLYAVIFTTEPTDYQLAVTNDCSVESINRWVYRNMNDYYLYADQVPSVNPETYESPIDLIRELRFEELDPFSGISNAARRNEFFNTGVSYGFGYNWRFDANDNARVTYVFNDSAFGRAGIKRGDIIVGIEGELWKDITRERYLELVGDRDNPRTTNWTFIDNATQTTREVLLTYGEFTTDTVLHTDVYSNESFSGKVGYIVFNEFLATSEAELDRAIAQLINQNATELILDLRYNPGGYIYIAQKLASQIGGTSLDGKALVRYEYNDKYTAVNFQSLFQAAAPSLNLNRVVILTSATTASSSELLINALEPYLDVVTIGGTTRGKPFISSSRNFCGVALDAMEAQRVNANGVSVAGGIAADCYATDDPTRPFGIQNDEPEGMLKAALDYYQLGTCDVGPAIAKRSGSSTDTPSVPHHDNPGRTTPGSHY